MKKLAIQIFLALVAAVAARGDTALTIPALYNCLTDFGTVVGIPSPPTVLSTFTLNGVSGPGSIQSQVPSYWDEFIPPNSGEEKLYNYVYSIDLSGMSPATNHCIRLLIHFGTPVACSGPGVQGNPSQIQSATLGPFGDIIFVFNSGCLQPGQSAISFSMISAPGFKTNVVTVIDDYYDPASGLTNEVKINVPAIVPDVPPDPPPWEIAYYYSRVNPVLFQGHVDVGTNQLGGTLIPTNGNYDLLLQLLEFPTNGPVVSQVVTQRVPIINGLFNVPLPGDLTAYQSGGTHYVSFGIRPVGGSGSFTQLNPPLPISPTPQALYAFSAGTVADISPDQAVTGLNGITGNTFIQAGPGIQIFADGSAKTITISQAGLPSDRNIKTDFSVIQPEEVLTKLLALPIEQWRFTNEVATVRHLGPTAQDFKAAFGLGNSDKTIGAVDESGVALAAIQGLNQRIEELKGELTRRDTENAELLQRLEKLEQMFNSKQTGNQDRPSR